MRTEEIQHGGQDGGIAKAFAQGIGGETGEREQPLGTVAVAQQPAERGERQGGRIRRGWGIS